MPYHRSDDTETILLELQAGIVPTSIFMRALLEKRDPFNGVKNPDAKKMKRKWRKLKKKFKVKNTSLSHASFEIRHQLRSNN